VKGGSTVPIGHKSTIIATIIAAVITAAVSLYIHFDSPKIDVFGTVPERTEANSDEKTATKSPAINIADIFITPIDTKMPTNFFVEISNSGNETARDIQLTINFGEATIKECEVQPALIASPIESKALSIQSYNITELVKGTSIYLSCSINIPYFKNIWVGGGNIKFEKSLSYDAYKALKNADSIGFYSGIWRVIVIFFLLMFGFKIVGFLFD